MSRNCTPLPRPSLASMVSASQRPFLSNANSATLPSVNAPPLARSCSTKSAPVGRSGGAACGPIGAIGAGPVAAPAAGDVGGALCSTRWVAASPGKAKRRTPSNSVFSAVALGRSGAVGQTLPVRRQGRAAQAAPGSDVGHADGPRPLGRWGAFQFGEFLVQLRDLVFQLGNLLLAIRRLRAGRHGQQEQAAQDNHHTSPKRQRGGPACPPAGSERKGYHRRPPPPPSPAPPA